MVSGFNVRKWSFWRKILPQDLLAVVGGMVSLPWLSWSYCLMLWNWRYFPDKMHGTDGWQPNFVEKGNCEMDWVLKSPHPMWWSVYIILLRKKIVIWALKDLNTSEASFICALHFTGRSSWTQDCKLSAELKDIKIKMAN